MKTRTQLKNTAAILALVILACFSFYCKKDTLVVNNPSPNYSTYPNVDSFFRANAVKSQFFAIDASSGHTLTSLKGSQIIVPLILL